MYNSSKPLYWFRVPIAVMSHLRRNGYYVGDPVDRDLGTVSTILMAFDRAMNEAGREKHLCNWFDTIDRKCCFDKTFKPALFHPNLAREQQEFIRNRFASILVEVTASTLSDALSQLNMTSNYI